jgi:hypothetical protein
MAFAGQLHSYEATVPHKRTVTDRIILADPMSIAGLNSLGLRNESKFAFANTPGKNYEWLQDTFVSRSDTVGDDADVTDDTTVATFTVTTGAKFQVGDVIQILLEYMWVSAISTNDITVTRGFGGTQATFASDATIYIRTNARLEGADAGDSPMTEATSVINYSQIFQKTIEISRTNALLKQYGIDNVVNREIDKAMDEKMMQLNLALYHGQKKVGSATAPRSFGGLGALITTNVDARSSAVLTQKDVEDGLQDAFDAGGAPNLLLVNSWGKRKIADFYQGYVRTERSERLGGIEIDTITMPLGLTVDVVLDRHCPAANLYMLDTRYAGFITLEDFFYENLGKVGDTADGGYGQVVGEYGFVAAYENAHAIISGFSTTA